MKFIQDTEQGWNHEPYWTYLETVEGVMREDIHAFAANPENHDLRSPNSLHDTWLQSLLITEFAVPDDPRRRPARINLVLLGQRHDRLINLQYDGIRTYCFENPPRFSGRQVDGGHGDLLIHELSVEGDGFYRHELLFAEGTTISVEFRDFSHWIVGLPPAGARQADPTV